MHLSRILATSAVLCTAVFGAHAQFHVVHDVPNITTDPAFQPLILADGGLVTHHWEDSAHIFRKYDGEGELLWSRALPGDLPYTWNPEGPVVLLPDGPDGFQFVRQANTTYTLVDTVMWMDHRLEQTYQIGSVNGAGVLTGSTLVKKTAIVPIGNFGDIGGFDAARTPDGGTILCSTTSEAASGSIDLVKVGAGGAVLWSRSVGMNSGPMHTPTVAFNSQPAARVAVSADGRIYVAEGGSYPYSDFRLAELDDDGALLWMKHYVYGNNSPMIHYEDIEVDAAGRVHGVGVLFSSVGRFHILLRTAPDGTLERGDIYRTPLAALSGHFGIDAQGRRYHRVGTVDPTNGALSEGVLVADTLGNPGYFLRRADEVVPPDNIQLIPQRMAVGSDRVALSGQLVHEHMDLAFTTRFESLGLLDTEDLTSCLMTDTTFSHTAVPLGIMTVTDVVGAVSVDIMAYYSAEPLTTALTDLDPEPLEPTCPFIQQLLGISTGLAADGTVEQRPLVFNSLVAPGTPLVITDATAASVAVYDMRGTLMHRTSLGTDRNVSTAGWPAGVYVLHAQDRTGAQVGTGRVAVE